jgi:hypothetical protein
LPDAATDARATNYRIAIRIFRFEHAPMFIRTPILDAVILSVLVAEFVGAALRLAAG